MVYYCLTNIIVIVKTCDTWVQQAAVCLGQVFCPDTWRHPGSRICMIMSQRQGHNYIQSTWHTHIHYLCINIYIYTCTLYILLCRFIVITMFIQYIITNSVCIYIYICTCIFHVSPDVFRYTWSARHRLFNMWQARLCLQASTTGPTADWAHMFSTKDMTVSLSMCIQILRCIYNHAIWSKCISKDI